MPQLIADTVIVQSTDDEIIVTQSDDKTIILTGTTIGTDSGLFKFPQHSSTGTFARTWGVSGSGSVIQPEAVATASPVFVGNSAILGSMSAAVNVAGSTGALLRFALYLDSGVGVPRTLVKDFGTIAATGTGVKNIVSSTHPALDPGLYWLVCAVQGGATTRPTIATLVGQAPVVSNSAGDPRFDTNGYTMTGVTGAFPAAFTVTAQTPQAIALTLGMN